MLVDSLSRNDGTLILVVGPSGAGKDSLIAAARQQLLASRFTFPQRIITRQDDSGAEISDYVTPEVFCRLQDSEAFSLHWEAHGYHYAIARTIDRDLREGRHVVVNVSRSVIGEARRRYPNLRIFLVTASSEVLRKRLAQRGREIDADIERRLERSLVALPKGSDVVEIVNDGALSEAVTRFTAELEKLDRPEALQSLNR